MYVQFTSCVQGDGKEGVGIRKDWGSRIFYNTVNWVSLIMLVALLAALHCHYFKWHVCWFYKYFPLFKCLPLEIREKFPYLEILWSVFSRIWTEYRDLLSKSLYSIRLQEKTNQKNSEYGNISCSVACSNGSSLYKKSLKKEKVRGRSGLNTFKNLDIDQK